MQEMEAALGDVREQLHAERKRRKALENWMHGELKSRVMTASCLASAVALRHAMHSVADQPFLQT